MLESSPFKPVMNKDNFQIITSLRSDIQLKSQSANAVVSGDGFPSPFYLFSFHCDRMLRAALDFDWPAAAQTLRGLNTTGVREKVATHLMRKYGDHCFDPLKAGPSPRLLTMTDGSRYALPYRVLGLSK